MEYVNQDGLAVRAYYTEKKIAVTGEDITRHEFYWGDDKTFRDELSALKAALSYVDGVNTIRQKMSNEA